MVLGHTAILFSRNWRDRCQRFRTGTMNDGESIGLGRNLNKTYSRRMRRRKRNDVNVDAKEVERIYKMVAAICSPNAVFEREFDASDEFALTQSGQEVSRKVDRFSHVKWSGTPSQCLRWAGRSGWEIKERGSGQERRNVFVLCTLRDCAFCLSRDSY